ncbi:MAG: recombinase family protein [Ktedonobacterales bacterium]
MTSPASVRPTREPPALALGPVGLGQRDKLRSWHRERLAVVYIRQSTAQQVLVHVESTRLQYGLVRHAEAYGWASDRILVIDEDLGKSGTTAVGRTGFERLVTEVSLGHVGLILGLEMSRLARSNVDWHRLLEVCALFGTLIADLDGLYDPAQYNDRLLLGLKGTMSEAEGHLLKQRLYEGCLSKARRGALTFALPSGYVWAADGTIQCDPDEQVQAVVRLIFAQFEALGTLGGLLRYLARHDIRLGIRVREGPGKGQLVWRRPNRATLQNMVKHPLYAGAYVYGRRQQDRRRHEPERPRSGRVVMRRSDWHALLPDCCPAYVTWEQYERNQARLAANRARASSVGAVRQGAALLAGLVVCARCGVRLGVHYQRSPRTHGRPSPAVPFTYDCVHRRNHYGEALCQHVPGPVLDAFVAQHVLTALQPAALELSLTAAEQVEQERVTLSHLWEQRRERAAYAVERAARQYQAVEPEDRLVARTLERAWEEQLQAQQYLEEEYHRFLQQQPQALTAAEREAIRRLATDIPALWHASTTTAANRKAILRQVVEQVEVEAQGTSEQVRVRILWVGGGQTHSWLVRPIARYAQRTDYARLCARVQDWTTAGWSLDAMAQQLEAEGYPPLRAGHRWSSASVQTLRRQVGLGHTHRHGHAREALGPDEWWASDLARHLAVPRSSLFSWIQRGAVQARKEQQGLQRWIIWADAQEIARLRQYHLRDRASDSRRRWTQTQTETE